MVAFTTKGLEGFTMVTTSPNTVPLIGSIQLGKLYTWGGTYVYAPLHQSGYNGAISSTWNGFTGVAYRIS